MMKNNTIKHCGRILRINDIEKPYFYASSVAKGGLDEYYPCVILEPVGVDAVSIETLGERRKGGIVGLDVIFDSKEEAIKKHKELVKNRLEKLRKRLEEVEDPKKFIAFYAQAVKDKDIHFKKLIRTKVKRLCDERGVRY